MSDLLTALALALAIEGALYALAYNLANVMRTLATLAPATPSRPRDMRPASLG